MVEETYREKYYRVYEKIDLDALCGNIIHTRKLLKADTRLMVIIKADGYGHGAVPVARAFDELDNGGMPVVNAYGVAVVEEGIHLRRAGITKPILVLGANPPAMAGEAVKYDISMAMCDMELAQAMSREAVAQGKTARVHIKVDTGMGRIGFAGSEADAEQIRQISLLPNLCIEGVFSHLACADEADKTSANRQFERFQAFCRRLDEKGVHPEVYHIANSAAIIDLPQMQLDMVRSGISTYGMYPSEEVCRDRLALTPVMELVSRISFIKEVPAGFPVGYGSTFVSEHPMRIATVPVGYADGFPRSLSGKGQVLIHGRRANIIGRICMDQFMVDVTDIPDVKLQDVVTLIGRDGDEMISVEELAALAGSFNYEFVCGITDRVPRIYYRNHRPVSVYTAFPEK